MNDKSMLYYGITGVLLGALLGGALGNLGAGLLIGVVVAVGAFMLRGRTGGLSLGRSGGRRGGSAYSTLMARAKGDSALVERLIRYEQSRNPGGTRNEWVADALDRWDRDR